MPVTPTASTHDADVAVVGAGAAGLYAALCAAREGASVVLVSATPLAQTASYWAQGGLAAALAADDSFELHLRTPSAPGAGSCGARPPRSSCARRPTASRDLQALGVRFDADRFGQLALGLEGGHSVRRVVHAGGSATGRRVVRQLSALVAEEPRIAVLEGARAHGRCGASDGRCRGVVCDDGAWSLARAGGDRQHRRRRGAVGAHDEPARLAGRRPAARARRRRGARRPRAAAVPPDRRHRRARPRGLPRHRGDPRRGRDAARRRRRALRRRARARATRSRARSRSCSTRPASARSASTCARSTRRTSRTSSPRCARRASTRRAS